MVVGATSCKNPSRKNVAKTHFDEPQNFLLVIEKLFDVVDKVKSAIRKIGLLGDLNNGQNRSHGLCSSRTLASIYCVSGMSCGKPLFSLAS